MRNGVPNQFLGDRLTLEGKAGTNLFVTLLAFKGCFVILSEEAIFHCTHLVGGLVQLLGIERGTDAEVDTGAEEDIVGDGSDTAVVDLGL